MLMKILHVTSDNKPGGIQKAFKSYVAALAPLSEFENFYFTLIIYIQTTMAIMRII